MKILSIYLTNITLEMVAFLMEIVVDGLWSIAHDWMIVFFLTHSCS